MYNATVPSTLVVFNALKILLRLPMLNYSQYYVDTVTVKALLILQTFWILLLWDKGTPFGSQSEYSSALSMPTMYQLSDTCIGF